MGISLYTQFFRQKNNRTYFSHAKAQRSRSVMFFCSSVYSKLHTDSQKYTEILLRMFCGCLRRLRETISHAVWVLCVPWIPCERISHADAADLRRLCETLRLCVKKICSYVLLSKKPRSSAKRVSQRKQREAFLPPYHTLKTNRRLIQFNMELN